MTAVKQPQHVIALLDFAFRGLKKHLERVTPNAAGLRPSHYRLLSYTPSGGIRLTELAAGVGMTKQALGEFVAALQEAGYLQVVPDPADRRARLVSPTEAGQRIQAALDEAITAAEREWELKVGPRRWKTFREVLATMAADDD